MNDLSPIAAGQAAPISPACSVSAIIAAAERLLPNLERGQRVDATILRVAMETGFGGSDCRAALNAENCHESHVAL
jgi:hypothetical protein